MPAVSGSPTQNVSSVSTALELAGLPDSGFSDGDLAYVRSLWPNGSFRLRRSMPTVTPDGVTTIAAHSGNGYWELFAGQEPISFPTVASIATYDDQGLLSGALGYDAETRSTWQKRVVSPAPASDGITVIATKSGDGAWYRLPVAHPSWQSQASWYIEPTTGSDVSDGATIGTALKTWAEFYRRSGGRLTVSTKVTLLGNTTEVLSGIFNAVGTTTLTLTIEGSPTATTLGASGTCTFTDPVPSTNSRGTLTSPTAVYTPYVGKLLRAIDPTAPTVPFITPLLTNNPYVGYWARTSLSNAKPSNTSSLEALTLPTVPTIQITANGIDCFIGYLDFTNTAYRDGVSVFSTNNNAATYFACIFRYVDVLSDTFYIGCLLQTGVGAASLGSWTTSARFIGGGSLRSIFYSGTAGTLQLQNFTIQGGTLTVGSTGSDTYSVLKINTGLGIFDSNSTAVAANGAALIYGPTIYGSGHTTGVSAKNGAQVRFSGTPTITTNAGTNEVIISKAPGLAGANDVIPIVAGVPTAPAVSMTTWATWAGATLNKYAINLADGTRICST